jgi:hypothetical protein
MKPYPTDTRSTYMKERDMHPPDESLGWASIPAAVVGVVFLLFMVLGAVGFMAELVR